METDRPRDRPKQPLRGVQNIEQPTPKYNKTAKVRVNISYRSNDGFHQDKYKETNRSPGSRKPTHTKLNSKKVLSNRTKKRAQSNTFWIELRSVTNMFSNVITLQS